MNIRKWEDVERELFTEDDDQLKEIEEQLRAKCVTGAEYVTVEVR